MGQAKMDRIMKTETLNIYIDRSWQDVYEFVSDLMNFPKWAKTFCRSVKKLDSIWFKIETPQGPTRIRISPRNEFGVVDHYLISPKGAEVYVSMRVVQNGAGSEIIFTLFQQPWMTNAQLASDRALVAQDLVKLKKQME